jgi:hypothetical protein
MKKTFNVYPIFISDSNRKYHLFDLIIPEDTIKNNDNKLFIVDFLNNFRKKFRINDYIYNVLYNILGNMGFVMYSYISNIHIVESQEINIRLLENPSFHVGDEKFEEDTPDLSFGLYLGQLIE